MKCPQCQYNQRYKEGFTCNKCRYIFALNPKQAPGISDMAFKNAIDRLSASGKYYFTLNQLIAHLVHLKRKKEKRNSIGCAVVGGILGIILGIAGFINFHSGSYGVSGILLFIIIALLFFIIKMFKGTPVVKYDEIRDAISKYAAVHPINQLADGKKLNGRADFTDSDILDFAPETILIVEHNDMAEMLIFNGLHLERKALILSADKYPASAFKAYQEIIDAHPNIPIALMHDASEQGLRMKGRLIKDPEWKLAGKNIKDLGLSPKDINQLKSPIWIPASTSGSSRQSVLSQGESMENINKGYTMPLDISPPKAIIGALGLSLLIGAPLLSEAFMAEQLKQIEGSGISSGYGFG